MIEIPLTRGHVALIDGDDLALVSPYKWCAILEIIGDDVEQLAPNQQKFVAQMAEGGSVSGKQLLWLRDIKDGML